MTCVLGISKTSLFYTFIADNKMRCLDPNSVREATKKILLLIAGPLRPNPPSLIPRS